MNNRNRTQQSNLLNSTQQSIIINQQRMINNQKHIISSQQNMINIKATQKWLVLDVDECLYPKEYINRNGGTNSFVNSFKKIHKEFALIYKDILMTLFGDSIYLEEILINRRKELGNNYTQEIRYNVYYTDDNFIDWLKSVNGGGNSIIGLFKLLRDNNIKLRQNTSEVQKINHQLNLIYNISLQNSTYLYNINDYHNIIQQIFPYHKILYNRKIKDAIDIAKENNMKIAIFSNGSIQHINEVLKRLSLDKSLFSNITCLDFESEDVLSKQKPNEKSFINFQSEIEANPENIYFFDDNKKNCRESKRQGWNTFFVNNETYDTRNTNIYNFSSSKSNENKIIKINDISSLPYIVKSHILKIQNTESNTNDFTYDVTENELNRYHRK